MSFNEQEGTCSCTLRRSSITQDIAREVSTTTAYSIGFVVEVVIAERKLTVLRLFCRRVVTDWKWEDVYSNGVEADLAASVDNCDEDCKGQF
ncbi:hypothetical protein TIFTF001_036861 [Ficus carica]|uniref:Uncharacterized protein n=1 Tax=Ficus carica TaxID=3494 RepID=A0AA88JBJ6_FICCA|nr:hypothetical protein TIFTF001_036861 [Ficus carica]